MAQFRTALGSVAAGYRGFSHHRNDDAYKSAVDAGPFFVQLDEFTLFQNILSYDRAGGRRLAKGKIDSHNQTKWWIGCNAICGKSALLLNALCGETVISIGDNVGYNAICAETLASMIIC